ncbi:MAG: hypothetical protein R3B60_01750 [Candidatus Paceibacterota bacterium]
MSTEGKIMVVIATSDIDESNEVANAIQGPQIDVKATCPKNGLNGLLGSLKVAFIKTRVIILSTDVFEEKSINIISTVKALRSGFPKLIIVVYRNVNDDGDCFSVDIKSAGANIVTSIQAGDEIKIRGIVYKQLDLAEEEVVIKSSETKPVTTEDCEEEADCNNVTSEEIEFVTDNVDTEELPEESYTDNPPEIDNGTPNKTTNDTGLTITQLLQPISVSKKDEPKTDDKTAVGEEEPDAGIQDTTINETEVLLEPDKSANNLTESDCSDNLSENNFGLSTETVLALVELAKVGIRQIEANLLQQTSTANSANSDDGYTQSNTVTKPETVESDETSDVTTETKQAAAENNNSDKAVPRLERVQISRVKYEVTVKGYKITLTKQQLEVLDILVAQDGKYLFAGEISKKLEGVSAASVSQRILALRKALDNTCRGLSNCIDSSSGRGYRFIENDK